MKWDNITQAIIFISLTGPGTVGNILVFMRHVCTSALGIAKKPVDLIIVHFTFSNLIILYSSVVKEIATVFYFRNFLGDIGCKAVVFLARMAWGLSICTTCLLSMVQAVTISPRTTLWTKLRPQTACHVFLFILVFWIVNVLISSILLSYIKTGGGLNRSVAAKFIGHCYMLPSRHNKWLFLFLMTLRYIIFQSLMGWSNGSMALHLYNCHKRVLYLHSYRSANNSPPEIRTTWSILILMACFLFFYWVDFIISFYTGLTMTRNFTLLNIEIF